MVPVTNSRLVDAVSFHKRMRLRFVYSKLRNCGRCNILTGLQLCQENTSALEKPSEHW